MERFIVGEIDGETESLSEFAKDGVLVGIEGDSVANISYEGN